MPKAIFYLFKGDYRFIHKMVPNWLNFRTKKKVRAEDAMVLGEAWVVIPLHILEVVRL